jgi:hypothetical protein
MPATATIESEFQDALRVWERAQVIQSGPAHLTEAAAFVDGLAARRSEFEPLVIEVLSSSNPIIAGYCLITLDRMKSERLQHLPAELFERRELITLQSGTYSTTMDLGSLARQIARKWQR